MENVTIHIVLKEKEFKRMSTLAEISKTSFPEWIMGKVRNYEDMSDHDFELEVASARKHQAEREHREWCKKFPKWKNWILKRDGKQYIELGFVPRPIVEHDVVNSCHKFTQENLGQYWLELSECTDQGFCSLVNKRDYKFYPTLKTLKRGVNSLLKKYGWSSHYQG